MALVLSSKAQALALAFEAKTKAWALAKAWALFAL